MILKKKIKFQRRTTFKFQDLEHNGKLSITLPAINYKPVKDFYYNYNYSGAEIMAVFTFYLKPENKLKKFNRRFRQPSNQDITK